MEFSKYEYTDNAYDLIERNKANILWLINIMGIDKPVDVDRIKPKYYDDANKFLAESQVGEIGRIVKDNGQSQLVVNAGNGQVAYFDNLVELTKMVELVRVSLQAKIDTIQSGLNNHDDVIQQLFNEIQVMENTWTGNQALTGGTPLAMTFDLKTINGDKGSFTFANTDKLNIKIGINGTPLNEENTFRINTESSFHIVGKALDGGTTTDVSFTGIVGTDGVLTIKDFHSTGSVNQNITGLRIKVVEQNPKLSSTIDTSLFLTQVKGDKRYVLKENKTTPLLQYQDQDATNKFLVLIHSKIDKELAYGDELKVKIDPTLLVAPDGTKITIASNSQIAFANGDFSEFQRVWKNKAGTDILNFTEIAHNLNDYIVLTKKQNDDTNGGADYWEFDRFESTSKTSITIDDTTLKALENDAI